MPAATWLRFLNDEARDLVALEAVLGKEFLRQILLGEAATNFEFPLPVEFRGVVTGQRVLDGVRHIEVAPAGLDRDAFGVLGGILVPCERDLYAGSAVHVRAALLDPDGYDTDIGVRAADAAISVLVPVEP